MRIFLTVTASLLTSSAFAQTASKPPVPMRAGRWAAQPSEELLRVERNLHRAVEIRPQRRDEPLRDLNISDNEVREIEALMSKVAARSMINISPVVDGCPCEEGPMCTAQVYVVAEAGDRSVALQLSRIQNAWVIGVVQTWWNRWMALLARHLEVEEFLQKQDELALEFPMCVGTEIQAKK
ncbi:MAG TPA: hypothetical protein VMF52_19655 [Steroidobacteraceae bacterium]|nr:hypothetical protein [Steroidobacteraceae bacterium]